MKVSVLMITYNHEEYIAQALDSILMQEVDFEYEIVVGEDCSTDRTREILKEYQRTHPQIRLLLPEINLGMLKNFVATYNACRGEYIAILEGDDFWTSSQKLKKQVTFLETHRETALCFHTTEVIYQDSSSSSHLSPSQHETFSTIEDLLETNFIQTCSVMFRKGLFGAFPDWFFSGVIGDYPLHILNAAHGNIGYIAEVMACYRVHSAGVWSMQMEKNFLRNVTAGMAMYKNIDTHFCGKYHTIIKKKLYEHELALYKYHLRHKNYMAAMAHAANVVTRYPLLCVAEKWKHEFAR